MHANTFNWQVVQILEIFVQLFLSVPLRLGNASKDRQRFVDAVVLILTPNRSNKLSNFENVIGTRFESVFQSQTKSGFARLIFIFKVRMESIF